MSLLSLYLLLEGNYIDVSSLHPLVMPSPNTKDILGYDNFKLFRLSQYANAPEPTVHELTSTRVRFLQ